MNPLMIVENKKQKLLNKMSCKCVFFLLLFI